ncbi:TnsD family Tn7-like transposition protein [Marinimicrobium sp. C2-29]|uniref:TnsD family Tn7-like transposition protein n=1 Tax=Marinimicrobium sp. C2-29 TaxID=3139825 RepID=UPI00313A0E6B
MEIPPTGGFSFSAPYASCSDIQLARLSSDMMRLQCGGSIDAAIAADVYRSRLSRKDLITKGGQVRQRDLKFKLLKFWENLTIYGTVEKMINSSTDLSYPSSIFYRRPSHNLPIKHLLIIGFLFNEWSDFMVSYINFRADGCRTDELGSNPDNQHTDDDEQSIIDKAIPLLKKGNSIRKASKLSGLSFVKTKALATGMGVNVKLRPQLLFEDKRRAIWRKLHIGESTDVISTSCNVSLGLVEQELTAHHYLIPLRKKIRFYKKQCHYREMIIDYMTEYPNCSRNDIRTALGSAYLWLYKNNSHLLYSLIPAEVPRQLRRSSPKST